MSKGVKKLHKERYDKAADEAEVKKRVREDKVAAAKAEQEAKRRKTQSEYEIIIIIIFDSFWEVYVVASWESE